MSELSQFPLLDLKRANPPTSQVLAPAFSLLKRVSNLDTRLRQKTFVGLKLRERIDDPFLNAHLCSSWLGNLDVRRSNSYTHIPPQYLEGTVILVSRPFKFDEFGQQSA